jgi:hypothetical protein
MLLQFLMNEISGRPVQRVLSLVSYNKSSRNLNILASGGRGYFVSRSPAKYSKCGLLLWLVGNDTDRMNREAGKRRDTDVRQWRNAGKSSEVGREG